MYKDVVRRVLAVVLTICLAVTAPNATLLAVTADSEDISTETSYEENEVSTEQAEDETEETVEETEETEETEEAEELQEPQGPEREAESETETETKKALSFSAVKEADEDDGIMALDGKYIGELTMPPRGTLPSQTKDTLTGDGTVAGKIIGLTIKDGDYELRQRISKDDPTADYYVTATFYESGGDDWAYLSIYGEGNYYDDGQLENYYSVRVGADIATNLQVVIENPESKGSEVEITARQNNNYLECSYTGQALPINIVRVRRDNQTLDSSQYEIIPKENLNAYAADGSDPEKRPGFIIRGISSYAGEKELNFTILPQSVTGLFNASLNLERDSSNNYYIPYNKKSAEEVGEDGTKGMRPPVTITYKSDASADVNTDDYRLEYVNNTGQGTASVIIAPGTSGNVTANTSYTLYFEIKVADLGAASSNITVDIENKDSYTYTGNQIKPNIEVCQDGEPLEEGEDYKVEYGENTNAGKGSITIKPGSSGNYTGEKTVTFDIAKFNIANFPDDVTSITSISGQEYEYTGERVSATAPRQLIDSANNMTLEADKDYEIGYVSNINAGTAYIVFKALADSQNCTGEKYIPFTIWKDIDNDYDGNGVTIDAIADQPYTGSEIKPTPVVKDAGTALREGDKTYEVVYSDSGYTALGTYEITVRFKGAYYRRKDKTSDNTDDIVVSFNIVKRKSSTLEAVFTDGGRYTYTGTAPVLNYAVRVKNEDIILPASDFTVNYGDGNTAPVDAGTYTVTIVPTAAAADKYDMEEGHDIKLTYTIDPKPIDGYSIQIAGPVTYDNGNKVEPAVTVLDENGNVLSADNYTVTYEHNVNAGTATVNVTGERNYTKTTSKDFTIAPKDLSTFAADSVVLELASVSPDSPTPSPYPYTGESIVPDIETLTLGGREIIKDGRVVAAGEATFESEAVNASTTGYTFTIKGQGNYTGSLESDAVQIKGGAVTFIIEPRDIGGTDVIVEDATMESANPSWNLSESMIEMLRNQVYNDGNAVTPSPTLTFNGKTLTLSSDYQLAYRDNFEKTKDSGKISVITITGQVNFTGTRTVYFRICEDIAKIDNFTLSETSYIYTSRECKPVPVGDITLDGQTLTEGIDYTIEWKNNIDALTMDASGNIDLSGAENPPEVVIVGIGDYGGTKEAPFIIEPVQIKLAASGVLAAPLSISIGGAPSYAATFTGSVVGPTLSIKYAAVDPTTKKAFSYELVENKDYILDLGSGNINASASAIYTMSIRPIGNFTYSRPASVTYIRLPLYAIKAKQINAAEIEVELLDDPEDIKVGVAPNFRVIDTKRDENGAMVEEGGTYVLEEGTDYTYSCLNYSAPGKASIQLVGINNYSGKSVVLYDIPGSLENATIQLLNTTDPDDADGYLFTGSAIKPKFKVTYPLGDNGEIKTLIEGTDFTYTPVECKDVGEYEIKLEGKGSAYSGSSLTKTFRITQRDLKDVKVNLPKSVSVNRDDAGDLQNVEPVPTLVLLQYTLQEGTDFTCTYEESCKLPSSARDDYVYTVTIEAAGKNFKGSVEEHYRIGDNFDVSVELADKRPYKYTGKEIKPELIVKDNKTDDPLEYGTDYDVSYSDNINAGSVTITVYGLAGETATQYCGSKTLKDLFTIEPIQLTSKEDIKVEEIEEEYTYDARAITPQPAVTWFVDDEEQELEEGTDFKYAYKQNVDAGTATVEISGANRNFEGTFSETFIINPKSLNDPDVIVQGIPDHVYTGSPINPEVTIYWYNEAGEKKDVSENDYIAEPLGNNTDVGSVEVKITGINNFKDTYSADPDTQVNPEFRIVKVKMSDITVEYEDEDPPFQYTGKQITPKVKLTYQSTTGETIEIDMDDQTKNWGCTITYGNNQTIGSNTGTITIAPTPSGSCEGNELTLRFAIVRRHIDDETISMEGIDASYPFNANGEPCKPIPILTFTPDEGTSYVLREGYDYVVSYKNNTGVTTEAAPAEITVTGIGNFDQSRTQTFAIFKNLADYIDSVSLDDTTLTYNGTKQYPDVNIVFKPGNTLELNVDYEFIWDDGLEDGCISAGEHTLVIKGKGEYSGGYSGENSDELEKLLFTIQPRGISKITFAIEDQVYIGSAIEPVIVGIDEEIDPDTPVGGNVYEIKSITNNTGVGTATVTVEAIKDSNYTGTAEITFNIVRANLEDKSYISVSTIESPQAYTGREIRPEIIITDSRRNVDGTAQMARDGECYTLREGVDYEVAYTANIYPRLLEEGELPATVTITGINNYEGTVTQIFDITADLALAEIDPIPAQEYQDGEAITPPLTVRLGDRLLREELDYNVTYENNTERGVATATITAVEGTFYTGSRTVSFNISSDLSSLGMEIRLLNTSFTYTGSEIRPTAAVAVEGLTLTEGQDYTVSYRNNINVGTAEVIVTGINGYSGSGSAAFTIIKRSITRCEFGSVENKVYNGKATSQNITVKDGTRSLVLNQDYSVSYAGHIGPGIATVTIAGLGNYGGTKTIRYLINVGNMTQVSATGSTNKVTLKWPAVTGAAGYAIYDASYNLIAKTTSLSYVHSNLSAVTTYTYNVRPYVTSGQNTYYGNFSNTVQATTTIARPVVTLKAYKKKIRVSWKRIKGVTGYEIYRSTKKSKGYKKVKTAKKENVVSYTNKNLTRKTKYYYKIRAYKTVNGKKIYSKYSAVKSVKTK